MQHCPSFVAVDDDVVPFEKTLCRRFVGDFAAAFASYHHRCYGLPFVDGDDVVVVVVGYYDDDPCRSFEDYSDFVVVVAAAAAAVDGDDMETIDAWNSMIAFYESEKFHQNFIFILKLIVYEKSRDLKSGGQYSNIWIDPS